MCQREDGQGGHEQNRREDAGGHRIDPGRSVRKPIDWTIVIRSLFNPAASAAARSFFTVWRLGWARCFPVGFIGVVLSSDGR